MKRSSLMVLLALTPFWAACTLILGDVPGVDGSGGSGGHASSSSTSGMGGHGGASSSSSSSSSTSSSTSSSSSSTSSSSSSSSSSSGCAAGTADCDMLASNGCEVDTETDVANCGGCATVCPSMGATPSCTLGKCGFTCSPGFGDCDMKASNACETALTTNSDCGACGTPCTLAGATTSCSTGTCKIASCTAPLDDCDGVLANGCEADTTSDKLNCGTCGSVCGIQNAPLATCAAGACVETCSAGYGNCDVIDANGCETATTNNINHCGGCNAVCSVAGGTPACTGSTCAIAACTAPNQDCANGYSDGCESNKLTDVANCGGCGMPCTNANGTTSCSGGVCKPVCAGGFADCDANPVNGCETPTTTAANCGACGHSCQGGTCASSICQPITLASGPNGPQGIAVDGVNAYWGNFPGNTVVKCAIGGCGNNPTVLAASQNAPHGVAIDAANVYWTNGDSIMKCAIGGCGGVPTPLATGQANPWDIGVDATSVYWTDLGTGGNGLVMKVSVGGSGLVALASTQGSPQGISVYGGNVYWANFISGEVMKCAIGGCGMSPATLAMGQVYPSRIAATAAGVFWTDANAAGTVMSVPLGGGMPATLASAQNNPRGIALDATDIYWVTDTGGTVMRVPIAGGAPVTLASGQNLPTAIALDAKCVYWTNTGGGTVMKLAK